MTERDFFRGLAEGLGGGAVGPLAALLLLVAFLALAALFVYSVARERRERRDAELLAFLVERHRVRDFELEALLAAARAERLRPPLVVLADPAAFAKAEARLRARLAERIPVPAQVEELLDDLKGRLFRS